MWVSSLWVHKLDNKGTFVYIEYTEYLSNPETTVMHKKGSYARDVYASMENLHVHAYHKSLHICPYVYAS